MERNFSLSCRLVIFFALFIEISSSEDCEKRKGFKAELRTSNDIKLLKALKDHEADMNIIIERQPRSINTSLIFTAPDCKHSEVLSLLREFGISDYEIFDPIFTPEQKPLQRSNSKPKTLTPEIVTSKYLSYDDGNTYIDMLAAKIRESASSVSVKVTTEGYSHEKREIKSITIENRSKPNNPVIFIDAGIHAREWHARAMGLYLLKLLAEEASLGEGGILSKASFVVVPSVNPDGYEFSRNGHKMWRKNRRPLSKECAGVDGNRNYDIKWLSGDRERLPCNDVYRGPKPFSESETKIIKNIMNRLRKTCKMYISIHSFGNSILYPYGWTTSKHPRQAQLYKVAKAGADAVAAITGGIFKPQQSGSGLYVAAGGSDDYAIDNGIPYAYTFELGAEQFGFTVPEKQLRKTLDEGWIVIKAMVLEVLKN